jgi:RNA-binding protein
MIKLPGKQNRFLRARGQTLTTAATIGKAGLTTEAVANVRELITQHELIKVRLPEGADRKAMAAELAELAGAYLAGVVGRTCLLYTPNPELPPREQLHLPSSRE